MPKVRRPDLRFLTALTNFQLPDIFFDWFKDLTGQSPSAKVLTHCRRELMHAIWRLLLDGELLRRASMGSLSCVPTVSREDFTSGFLLIRRIIQRSESFNPCCKIPG
jgi:hypothetical protein